MLVVANRKNLKRFAKDLLANEYSPETERELIKVCLTPISEFQEGNRGHISHARAEHLEAINEVLNSNGVEGILENGIDVQYVNAGDTYALTILYYEDKLWIGDWGSIVEESEE
jgi:hypothetical protein